MRIWLHKRDGHISEGWNRGSSLYIYMHEWRENKDYKFQVWLNLFSYTIAFQWSTLNFCMIIYTIDVSFVFITQLLNSINFDLECYQQMNQQTLHHPKHTCTLGQSWIQYITCSHVSLVCIIHRVIFIIAFFFMWP